jgi:integrase
MGRIYRQRQHGKVGKLVKNWTIDFYAAGVRHREATGTASKREAERLLRQREGQAALGAPVPPRVDRLSYREIIEDLKMEYRNSGARNLREAGTRLKHLDQHFGAFRAAAITSAEIAKYVSARLAAGASPSSVNKETGVLMRAIRLAAEHEKLTKIPITHKLKEAAPRAGFLEPEQFARVYQHLPDDVQTAALIAYRLGWRTSEVLHLERRHVSTGDNTLTLDAGSTKNGDGRVIVMPADVAAAVGAQLARVDALSRTLARVIPWLFPHFTGVAATRPGQRHVAVIGARKRNYRRAWDAACAKAGLPRFLRHDMRRSAVRNLVNANVPERVAMAITGHKTRAVFDRYHIVSPGDLEAAAKRLDERNRHTLGIPGSEPAKSRRTSVEKIGTHV